MKTANDVTMKMYPYPQVINNLCINTHKYCINMRQFPQVLYQGQTVVSPYVGMVRKQDGGSNGCISNYRIITQLGASVVHFETLFCPLQALP